MSERAPSSIRFSRVYGVGAAVALAAGTSVALGALVAGPLLVARLGPRAPAVYLVAAVVFLPLILAYAEFAARASAAGGVYTLLRRAGPSWLGFYASWFAIAGFVAVADVLARSSAVLLAVIVRLTFHLEVDPAALVILVVVGMFALQLINPAGLWRVRTTAVWLGLIGLTVTMAMRVVEGSNRAGAVVATDSFEHRLTSIAILASALWFIFPVLQELGQLKRPAVTALRTSIVVWLGTCAIGAVVAMYTAGRGVLLFELLEGGMSWQEARLETVMVISGFLLCATGLSRALANGDKLIVSMSRDGLLPRTGNSVGRALAESPLAATCFYLLVIWASTNDHGVLAKVGMVALATLAFSTLSLSLLLVPSYAKERWKLDLSLPLHPVIPSIAVGSSVLLLWVLPEASLHAGFAWLCAGVVVYLLYSHGAHLATSRVERVGAPIQVPPKSDAYRVLVAVENAETGDSLIRAGLALARSHDGEVLVLCVVPLREHDSHEAVREAAEQNWATLNGSLAELNSGDTRVLPLVRMAPGVASGVLATASEFDVDFIMFGWPAHAVGSARMAQIQRIFDASSRPLALFRRGLPTRRGRVVTATAGGPHAAAGLRLADALRELGGGDLELLSVSVPGRSEIPAEQAVAETMAEAGLQRPPATRVVEAREVKSGILDSVDADDVLVLGASVDRLIGRSLLGGLSESVAADRAGITIVVKRGEKAGRFVVRRLWEAVTRLLPQLTVADRNLVMSDLRKSARASTDFFALIILASFIAVFGLIQDSTAVIIGAMLVAPLMSPILALAHGIVLGNMYLLREGAASTIKGVSAAIGVSLAAALIAPHHAPTGEMLARGHPSLLDLLVAMAAGAAAAYGASRKSVSASLPGVAISVALVPPLCVVGWGLGASHFGLAAGAMVLFLTNFVAIVLVGALVFLLLGFRPTAVQSGGRVRRAISIAVVAILVVMIPLTMRTQQWTQEENLDQRIELIVRRLDPMFEVDRVDVEWVDDELVVTARVLVLGEMTEELRNGGLQRVAGLRELLERAAEVPVRLRIRYIPATYVIAGPEGVSQSRQLYAEAPAGSQGAGEAPTGSPSESGPGGDPDQPLDVAE